MSYDILYGFMGIVLALLFFVGSLLLCARAIRRASTHTRQVRHDVERMELRYIQLQKQLEIAKAAVVSRNQQLEQISADLKTMREETTGLILRADAPLYVLADRWTPADSEFLVSIRNPSMAGRPIQKLTVSSWVDGRTYVVWAPTAEIAGRHVEGRFAAASGYEMGAVIASPLNLAKRWEFQA